MLKDSQLAFGEKVSLTGKGPFLIFGSCCRGQKGRGERGMAISWATAGKEWKKIILGKEVERKGRRRELAGLMLICLYRYMESVQGDELCAEGCVGDSFSSPCKIHKGLQSFSCKLFPTHRWPSPGQGLGCLLCLSMWQGVILCLHLRRREGGWAGETKRLASVSQHRGLFALC